MRAITILDDAGKSVPLFDPGSVDRRTDQGDHGLLEIAGRIRERLDTPENRSSLTSTANLYSMIFAAVGIGVVIILQQYGLQRWMTWVIGGAIGFLTPMLVHRVKLGENHEDVLTTLRSEGRCGSCGYALAALLPDGAGLTTCAECGARWKIDRERLPSSTSACASQPRTALPPSSEILVDTTGRTLRAPDYRVVARNDHRVGEAYKASMQATRAAREFMAAFYALVGVGFLAWAIIQASFTKIHSLMSAMWVLPPIALAMFGVIAFMRARQLVRSGDSRTTRRIAEHLIRADCCPVCLGSLTTDASGSPESRRCASCAAIWSTEQSPTL